MRRAGFAVLLELIVGLEGEGDIELSEEEEEREEGVVGSTIREARGVSSAFLTGVDHDAEEDNAGTGENEADGENEVVEDNDDDDDEPGVKGSGTVVIAQ